MWEIPTSVEIDGLTYNIRNKGDFRVVLDCFLVLNDIEYPEAYRVSCALSIFYENYKEITNFEAAVEEMYIFMQNGQEETRNNKPKLISWDQDFRLIVAPISRIAGKDIRSMEYLHWWTFLSYYLEIGECLFSQIVSIRSKKKKGKKLQKHEQEFYRENYDLIKLKEPMTEEERAWVNSVK